MSAERASTEQAHEAIQKRLHEANDRMEKSIEALHKELGNIRTGRASPALVESLGIEQYGTTMPLQGLAGVSAPEARLLVIKPYDKSSIQAIEKAILNSDLGLTPNNDGEVIRINLPQLTEERRKEMVKQVHRKAEDARISIRNIRRDEVEGIRKLEKDGHVGKDEVETAIGDVQKVTDKHTSAIDDIAKRKEAEVLEV
jgi:ribosome recycling factor